jgi:hypothetical protein
MGVDVGSQDLDPVPMGGRAVYGMKEKTGKKILNQKLMSLPYRWRMAKSGTYD